MTDMVDAFVWVGGRREGVFVSTRMINDIVVAGKDLAIAALGAKCRHLEEQLKEQERSNA
jgi:hypothetical protein